MQQCPLKMIEKRLSFLMRNFEVKNEQYNEFFIQLENEIIRLKHTRNNYQDRKQLGKFIWNIFAGWSYVNGYRDTDIIEEMINSI